MVGDLHSKLERWIAPLKRQLRQMVMQAILSTVDDSSAMQIVSAVVGQGEQLDGIQRIQAHGLTSNPKGGAMGLVLLVGGNRDIPVAVCFSGGEDRPTGLQPGEVAVYKDKSNYILFKDNGDVEIKNEGKVLVTPTGDIELGSVGIKTLMKETFQSVYNAHTHLYSPGPLAQVATATPLPLSTSADITSKTKAE